jgi:hypothetical protein
MESSSCFVLGGAGDRPIPKQQQKRKSGIVTFLVVVGKDTRIVVRRRLVWLDLGGGGRRIVGTARLEGQGG